MNTLAKYTKQVEQDICTLALLMNEETIEMYYIDQKEMSEAFRRPVKIGNGANKNAIIFDNYVLKYARDCSSYYINQDFKAYQNYLGTWAEQFTAETHLVKCMGKSILVQESVTDVGSTKYTTHYNKLMRLFKQMNFGDYHQYNLGWKTIGNVTIPRIIDFEYSSKPKEKPFIWE